MISIKPLTTELNRIQEILGDSRPSIHSYYMAMAYLASTRSTCIRRRVGCVLVDKNNRVLSIGYNGVPRGMRHCIDNPCAGASAKSGTNLDLCEASHAEQSALMACKDIEAIYTAYVTSSPCNSCVKLLANTGCQNIVFGEEYPHNESGKFWMRMGRKWLNYGYIFNKI